jgi:hypothetical protein
VCKEKPPAFAFAEPPDRPFGHFVGAPLEILVIMAEPGPRLVPSANLSLHENKGFSKGIIVRIETLIQSEAPLEWEAADYRARLEARIVKDLG